MTGTGRFFSEEADGIVRCSLCPHRCAIKSGLFGACGVRGNKGGTGILPFYGFVSALALDPIEKKPLYHFRPGSSILSIGFVGCNLHCPFCQNWRISQNTDIPGRRMKPGEIVSAALHENSLSIAYTYSEPLVHAEYLLDCMALARRHGIANVLVTNGCVNAEAAEEILSLTDAANIDLKCFSASSYSGILGGGKDSMEAILDFARLARKMGVHIEITTLVVPGFNDSGEELDRCADFIAGLSDSSDLSDNLSDDKSVDKSDGVSVVPWHLSAYHPDYRWNAPPADPALLLAATQRARKKLPFVYTGNIPAEENDTLCLHCGSTLVRRRAYRVNAEGLAPPSEGDRVFRCAACGERTSIIA